MYKDKPYAYPGSRRKQPWYKQKRTVAVVLTSFAAISWWFGILSPLSYFTSESSGPLSTSGSKGSDRSPSGSFSKVTPATWEARAEKVRETFKISFDGYEKYAWGMCRVRLSW